MRVQLVPGREPPDLLDLPWPTPLAEWNHPRLIRMVHGVSRHVVRFVSDGERVFALKEIAEAVGRHEYAILRRLVLDGLPAVEAVGLVTGRAASDGRELDAILVTRYLDYSLPYQYLFSVEAGRGLDRRLIDAAVVLLVRLHLDGYYWGDSSLANLLFRRDAGALMAYLVDAETAEYHSPLPDGLREADVDIARENFAGGLLDLQAHAKLPADVDVLALADLLEERYASLWNELTGVEESDALDRHLIDRRIRRLNELGFDVGELVVEQDAAQSRMRVRPELVEEGHHSRELRRLTGLAVQENQARRLLNDIAAFGAYLAREAGHEIPQAVAAARWLDEVFEPTVAQVPDELRGRLEAAELFHEMLEHRYSLSETAGVEVGNENALRSYLDDVLRFRPNERLLTDDERVPGSPHWPFDAP